MAACQGISISSLRPRFLNVPAAQLPPLQHRVLHEFSSSPPLSSCRVTSDAVALPSAMISALEATNAFDSSSRVPLAITASTSTRSLGSSLWYHWSVRLSWIVAVLINLMFSCRDIRREAPSSTSDRVENAAFGSNLNRVSTAQTELSCLRISLTLVRPMHLLRRAGRAMGP